MDAALLAMLTDTVQHHAFVSVNDYGTPTYASAVSRAARVEHYTRQMTNTRGQEVTSRAKMFLNGDIVVKLEDRFTLPDGTSPAIQDVYPSRDEDGAIDHWEVFF